MHLGTTLFKNLDEFSGKFQTTFAPLPSIFFESCTQLKYLRTQLKPLRAQLKSLLTQLKSLQTQLKSLQTKKKSLQTQLKSLHSRDYDWVSITLETSLGCQGSQGHVLDQPNMALAHPKSDFASARRSFWTKVHVSGSIEQNTCGTSKTDTMRCQ